MDEAGDTLGDHQGPELQPENNNILRSRTPGETHTRPSLPLGTQWFNVNSTRAQGQPLQPGEPDLVPWLRSHGQVQQQTSVQSDMDFPTEEAQINKKAGLPFRMCTLRHITWSLSLATQWNYPRGFYKINTL